jgi:hypothetical protein
VMMKHLGRGLALAGSLGTLGYLVVATIVAVLAPHKAFAAANGDLYSNGKGQFVCICGGSNCQPCGNVT